MSAAPQFHERAAHETGFAAFYLERIRPVFQSLKAEEKKVRRAGLRSAAIVLLAGVLPVAGALWLRSGPMGGAWWPAVMVGLVVLFIAGMVLAAASGTVEDLVRKTVLPLLIDFRTQATDESALRFVENPAKDFVDAKAFGNLRLFPDALFPNSFEATRGIEGTWKGVPYRMAHVLMQNEIHRASEPAKRKTLFSGGLLQVPLDTILAPSLERPLPLTVFCADREGLGPFGGLADLVKSRAEIAGTNVLPVPLADPELEKIYDVYSEDPDALPEYFSSVIGRALTGIATDILGVPRYLAAAVLDGRFYVAFPASDLPHRHERGFLDLRAFGMSEGRFLEELRAALEDLAVPEKVVSGLLDLRAGAAFGLRC